MSSSSPMLESNSELAPSPIVSVIPLPSLPPDGLVANNVNHLPSIGANPHFSAATHVQDGTQQSSVIPQQQTPQQQYYDPQATAYYNAYQAAMYAAMGAAAANNQANYQQHPYIVAPMAHSNQQDNVGNYNQQLAYAEEEDLDSDSDDPTVVKEVPKKSSKGNNILPIWGNEKTMNMNPLILTNIQNSPYFKTALYTIKTFHEVVDEIWYQVKHLEPWEKGSRKVSGQTGMCGSVRGVGAGGIVSTPFCILYKLYTLRLTHKQVISLLKHKDSSFIRGIGLMYIRYTQPPENLWSWYKSWLGDEEYVDPKAGGGQPMTIGQMARHMLIKLDWFSTLFPRIPVPIQKDIEKKLKDYELMKAVERQSQMEDGEVDDETGGDDYHGADKEIDAHERKNNLGTHNNNYRASDKPRRNDVERLRERESQRERHERDKGRHEHRRRRSRSRSRERHGSRRSRSRSREARGKNHRAGDGRRHRDRR